MVMHEMFKVNTESQPSEKKNLKTRTTKQNIFCVIYLGGS